MTDQVEDRSIQRVGEQRQIKVGALRITGRRRRPSGEKAPLPRALKTSGWLWLLAALTVLLIWLSIFLWPETERFWYQADHRVTFWLADLRTGLATGFMETLDEVGSNWTILALRWGTIAVLVVFRRWRHLLVFVAAIALLESFVGVVNRATIRERPLGVEIIGSWSGSSHPSGPIAALTVTLVAMRYSLLPKGRFPARWWVVGALVTALAVARLYLGVDHPTDVLFGFLLAFALGVAMFRLLVPASAFPVEYTRHRAAHLDVGGERRDVLMKALRERMGLEVTSIEPFALEGSAGSTPLRLTVQGELEDQYLFAKLYALNHLRSDRWYKLARTILYGYLEDEVRFNSVTRLVEYEDYMLRVMRDAGLPSPEPYGFVELIPEREYLIVTEFIPNAQELDRIDVPDEVSDDAFRVVRALWDAGIAHRDIKPANVLVAEGKIKLIDVAFATARPTPWRQAVDLANMMLILALQVGPDRVYERALQHFTSQDIAEAFAATQSVTMPSQLRSRLREYEAESGTDLVEAFRTLAPPADPISVQRWSLRRIAITAGVLAAGAGLLTLVISNLRGTGFL